VGFSPGSPQSLSAKCRSRQARYGQDLALNLTGHVAVDLQRPVGVFSLEMRCDELGLKLGSAEADLASSKLRVRHLSSRQWRDLFAAVRRITRATYDAELAGLEEALTFTSLELRDAAMEDFDMEASLGFARSVMTRTYQLWEAADPDQKRRLQKLIFPEGVSFDGEAHGEALVTPVTALIFSVLGPEMTEKAGLVAHTGFEPVLPA
jgi:hypothetical protein